MKGVGLDTVTAVFRVERADLMGLPEAQSVTVLDGPTGQISTASWGVLPSGLRVRTRSTRDDGERLIVEGSLPKLARGSNFRPLEVSEYEAVMRDVVVPELQSVAVGLRDDDWNHSRLDAVTDLDCDESDIAPVLRGFEAVPIRKGVRRSLIRSTTDRAETLTAMNKGGGVRAYDKVTEAMLRGESFPGGRGKLRVESQSRSDWLKSSGTRTSADVIAFPNNVERLHEKRVEWAGLNREVVTTVTAIEALDRYCRENGYSQSICNGVMCYLLRAAHGLPIEASKATLAKYRRIARACGVQPVDVKQEALHEVRYRLDFEKATVVRSAA